MDCLAFLPIEDIPAGMRLLTGKCPEEGVPLLNYFNQTYVSGTYVQRRFDPQERTPRLIMKRIPPRFPPQIWNIHQATLNDDPKTKNLREGWNNKFYHLVGYHHPSIWKLMKM